MLNGISNKVRGDGDNHMRGMSCLLTGDELLPGNIMGGGGNPAGWASSISIDQEIKNFLQSRAGDEDALRLAGVRRRGAEPRRSVDAHELRRRRTSPSRRSMIRTGCSRSSTAR